MKIAIFSDCYLDLTGGIVSSIDAQKDELERRGHTVCVFSSSFPRTRDTIEQLAKKHIYPVPSCAIFGRGITPIARRPRVIEKWLVRSHPELANFDVFYVHYEAGCSIAGLRLAKKYKIPSIQVMHGREDMGEQLLAPRGFRTIVAALLDWFHSWYLPHPVKVHRGDYLAPTYARAFMWTLMVNHANAADLVLTPSAHFRAKLKKNGVTRPIKVLPNGVPDVYFTSDPTPRVLEPGKPLQFIWHSRLSPEKRPLVFLEALSLVRSPYRAAFYGGGPDLARARNYAVRHGLRVTFHGTKSFAEIYTRIAKSDLDVLISSGYDTFGMTIIEAAAAGTPTLYVDPDMDEIVPARVSASGSKSTPAGVRAADPSPTAIATAIDDLYDHPDRLTELSRALLKNRDSVRVSHAVDLLLNYITHLTHA